MAGSACSEHGAVQCSSCDTGYYVRPERLPAGAFTASLGAKNGVPAQTYTFRKMYITNKVSRYYSDAMIARCATVGMKPVCDNPGYCKHDERALYLGQNDHLAYRPQRYSSSYMPSGFGPIRHHWDGLCTYTARANGRSALCNTPSNSHS